MVQISILDIMFNNNICHLVYMRDITSIVNGQIASATFDPISDESHLECGQQVTTRELEQVSERLLRDPMQGLKEFQDRIRAEDS